MAAETKTTFTPGPWRAKPDRLVRQRGRVYVEGSGGWNADPICAVDYRDDVSENEANAHLIAAAPDLYEALDRVARMIAWMEEDDRNAIVPDGLQATIRAALRRARGEG